MKTHIAEKEELELYNGTDEQRNDVLYFWSTFAGPCRIVTPEGEALVELLEPIDQ